MLKKLFLNDIFILYLIILNAIIIFISGFDFGEKNNFTLSLIDNGITILFITELIFKLIQFGKGYFKSNWNKFDFVLIVLSIPAFVAFILNANVHDFSFFLVFRVMRVFKSFRFLKFVPGIDHLIRGIQRALKASIIIMLGFIVYIFIVGLFSFYLFKENSPEYFGNPLISLYSTFKIFTVEGWFEIPEQVNNSFSSTRSFFTYIYFIFVVLSGGILGLSLVNSIFVDAMVSDNNDELEKKIDNLELKIDKLLNQQ
ncbi:ion transporter [Rhodonellum sp.]|uniref:ion transporter n=1 Tax=Rhodonellum sp. TaxID=2231180 RepID=UPI0027265B5A|nr:ion transporter [Rhodonellum sp.]MDO9551086.1 ion transporter [Rhodonellum sp.]